MKGDIFSFSLRTFFFTLIYFFKSSKPLNYKTTINTKYFIMRDTKMKIILNFSFLKIEGSSRKSCFIYQRFHYAFYMRYLQFFSHIPTKRNQILKIDSMCLWSKKKKRFLSHYFSQLVFISVNDDVEWYFKVHFRCFILLFSLFWKDYLEFKNTHGSKSFYFSIISR